MINSARSGWPVWATDDEFDVDDDRTTEVRREPVHRAAYQVGVRHIGARERERESIERLPELLKTTLLTTTSGAMYSCLCMHIDDLASYQQPVIIVVCYCKTSASSASAQSHFTQSSRTTDNGPAPMDIDAFCKREGK